MTICLSLAGADDADALARLFFDSIHGLAHTHYSSEQLAAWAPPSADLQAWRERLMTQKTRIARIDGRLAGFLAHDDDGHIDLLYVAPDCARRGVASALYRACEADVRAGGATQLFTEASLVAEAFFRAQGFAVSEVQDVERNGLRFRRYAMCKTLGA